jgi:NDP-sugar pyrophosphorylase family protein
MNFGIIAAGEGSRLAQEGVERPKPLVDLNGEPMIGRLIHIFESLGAGRVSVIVNEQMTEVADYLRTLAPQLAMPMDLVVKSTPSSMHSFYELGGLLRPHGRFILTTVDTIFRADDFRRYVDAFSAAPAGVGAMMAVTSYIDDEKPLYVATDEEMHVKAFLDTATDTEGKEARYVSGGIYGLDTRAIDVLTDCMERGVSRMRNFQRALVASGLDVRAFDMGKIMDVDHASDIIKAKQFING